MNSCFVCLRPTAQGKICFQCRQCAFVRNWWGCARCGTIHCSGACNGLTVFESVNFLLPYSTFLSSLLNDSKNKSCPGAIQVFESLFKGPTLCAITRLIESHAIKTILLGPLSLTRIHEASWHPLVFLRDLIRQNFSQIALVNSIVLDHLKVSRTRRQENSVATKGTNNSRSFIFDGVAYATQHSSCLLMDDVLTSGISASTCAHQFQMVYPQQRIHLFTILRSPQ